MASMKTTGTITYLNSGNAACSQKDDLCQGNRMVEHATTRSEAVENEIDPKRYVRNEGGS